MRAAASARTVAWASSCLKRLHALQDQIGDASSEQLEPIPAQQQPEKSTSEAAQPSETPGQEPSVLSQPEHPSSAQHSSTGKPASSTTDTSEQHLQHHTSPAAGTQRRDLFWSDRSAAWVAIAAVTVSALTAQTQTCRQRPAGFALACMAPALLPVFALLVAVSLPAQWRGEDWQVWVRAMVLGLACWIAVLPSSL